MIIKETIETVVKNEYDVAVCGGGFAGISAALAAARQGSKVVLFEKHYILGGLGTAGIVTYYLPLCDGYGNQVSFGTLYNSTVKNLICAGRCTSVNETMWDIMRVIPCCAVTGQAAGTAAAMTDDFSTFNVKDLQEELKLNGVVLHENDIIKK